MNYTPLKEAYEIHHSTTNNSFYKPVTYSPVCIHCNCSSSIPLINDGGSFRMCDRCKKQFKATILEPPVQNYANSTSHLKGTN